MKISVTDGEPVKRDQELLRLDQQDILTQIQEMERSIEAAKLRTQRAKRDYERLVDLQKRGVVTAKDFEDARITLSLSENDAAIAEARAAKLLTAHRRLDQALRLVAADGRAGGAGSG